MANPPPPSAVFPPPDPGYWCLLDLEITHGPDLSVLQVATDALVRLYMAAGFRQPSAVPVRRKRRGLWRQVYTLWRFEPDGWVTQDEPGETQIHTFTLGDWPSGINLWYYFDGRQNGARTVSTSVLFGSLKPELVLAKKPLASQTIRFPGTATWDYTHAIQPAFALTPVP